MKKKVDEIPSYLSELKTYIFIIFFVYHLSISIECFSRICGCNLLLSTYCKTGPKKRNCTYCSVFLGNKTAAYIMIVQTISVRIHENSSQLLLVHLLLITIDVN